MKKILIATGIYPPDIGGPAKYAKEIHEELERKGIAAPVVAYRVIEHRLPIGLRHLVYFFRLIPDMVGTDVVLAFDTWSVGLPALVACKLMRKKIMVRIGGDFLWESYVERTGEMVLLSEFYTTQRRLSVKERVIKWGTDVLVRRADALVFNTVWQQRLWARAYGFKKEQAFVVENFFPAHRTFVPSEGKTFVASGRSLKLKNAALLATVFAEVQHGHTEASLDMEHLPGSKNQERLRRGYAVVVPSISEVNPNNVIEGLAYGKPFIAPLDCGLYERLHEVGVFVDTLNPDAMRKALEDMLTPAFYEERIAAIKNFTYEHSWVQITDEMLAIANSI